MILIFWNVICSKFYKFFKLVKYCMRYVVYIYIKCYYIFLKKICLDEFKLFMNFCNFVYIGFVIDWLFLFVFGIDVSKKCFCFLKMILNVLRELCFIIVCLFGFFVLGVWYFLVILVLECE